MTSIQEIETFVDEKLIHKKTLENQLDKLENKIAILRKRKVSGKKAQALIQKVAQDTKKDLKTEVESLVTLALQALYPQHKFKMDLVKRRNTTECDLLVIDPDGHECEVLFTYGGGVADIVSFALRLTCWVLSNSSPTLITDEPFKNIDKNRQVQAGELLKYTAEKMGIQFIIMTHEIAIIDSADKVFLVENGKIIEE